MRIFLILVFFSFLSSTQATSFLRRCTMDLNEYGHSGHCDCLEGEEYNPRNGLCEGDEKVVVGRLCTRDLNQWGHSGHCNCPEGLDYNETNGLCEQSEKLTSMRCTHDLNQWGHSGHCDCPGGLKYDQRSGACVKKRDSNGRLCTSDLNPWGHSGHCDCEEGREYNERSGRCEHSICNTPYYGQTLGILERSGLAADDGQIQELDEAISGRRENTSPVCDFLEASHETLEADYADEYVSNSRRGDEIGWDESSENFYVEDSSSASTISE